jgi:F0F1-type ATP synthase assembly protein I
MDSPKDIKKGGWQESLTVFLRLSSWIAFPVLAGVFIGRWLDRKYDSEPWLFLLSVGAAFVVSMFGLVINAIKEFKKIEAEAKKKK